MTVKEARATLAASGMTLRVGIDEYRVNFKGGTPETAYYTSDLDDAVTTGQVMAINRPTQVEQTEIWLSKTQRELVLKALSFANTQRPREGDWLGDIDPRFTELANLFAKADQVTLRMRPKQGVN